MKIHICIPAFHNQTHTSLILGLLQLLTDINKRGDSVAIDIISTPLISYSRNYLMEKAKDADWVLMWDTDVEVNTPGFFYKMVETAKKENAQMIGLFTRMKTKDIYNPEYACGFKKDGKYDRMITMPREPVEVDFVAGGLHILDNNWIRKNLKQPFYTIHDLPGPHIIPEDWSLCEKIKSVGGKVVADPTIPTTHWGLYGWEARR